MMTDPIADMLTRIRNALQARHERVTVPASNLKLAIAEVLKSEGYVADVVRHERGPQGEFSIVLKYAPDGTPIVQGIERASRTGRRYYAGVQDVPRVRGGLGVAVLTTSQGVMADREARRRGVGGEVLCRVW